MWWAATALAEEPQPLPPTQTTGEAVDFDDVAAVWRPFAERLAALAIGGPAALAGPDQVTGPGFRELPLLGA